MCSVTRMGGTRNGTRLALDPQISSIGVRLDMAYALHIDRA